MRDDPPTQHEKMLENLIDERYKEEFSRIFEIAVDRWLDKQFSRFGKWAIMGVVAALFVWALKIYIQSGGLGK